MQQEALFDLFHVANKKNDGVVTFETTGLCGTNYNSATALVGGRRAADALDALYLIMPVTVSHAFELQEWITPPRRWMYSKACRPTTSTSSLPTSPLLERAAAPSTVASPALA